MKKLTLIVLALGACRSKSHESVTSPVRDMVCEVRTGTRIVASYRKYFAPEVGDAEIREATESLRLIVKRLGVPVRYEVEHVEGDEARVRLWFRISGDEPSFPVTMAGHWSGWKVRRVDLEPVAVWLRSAESFGSGSEDGPGGIEYGTNRWGDIGGG